MPSKHLRVPLEAQDVKPAAELRTNKRRTWRALKRRRDRYEESARAQGETKAES